MKKILLVVLGLSILLSSCKKENNSKSYNVVGYAQKGPFLTGANVTIMELDSKLNPTGRVFTSTIVDNTGKFTFPNVQFASSYVQIKVTGRAYNEVVGGIPMEDLTLQSIADLSTTTTVNVNIMTNMVEARLKTLVDAGSSFKDAKTQSETELLKAFYLDSLTLSSSETSNLTNNSVQGGTLLLVSAIIQSNIGTNLTFQEYVTNLQTDFMTDGVLNSALLTRSISSSAIDLNVDQVMLNLKNRYSESGITFTPYDIKPLLKIFKKNCKYISVYDNIFPVTVNNASNLISNLDTIIIDKNVSYVIAINCPPNNAFSSMQVAITSTSNDFVTSNADFYTMGDTKRFMKDMTDNTNLVIPISFSGTGQLTLHIFPMINGVISTKTYIVIWK